MVPSLEVSVPMEMGYITLLLHGHIHQIRSSPNPILLGFYEGFIMEVRLVINSISSPFSHVWRTEVGPETSKLQSQLSLSGDQIPSRSHLEAHPDSLH